MARLRAGDDAAYETLVRTQGPQMLAVARRHFSTLQDAEDVLQSAFVLVFRFIHTFEGTSRLSTWLHRIVVNCALMRIRSRSRHPEQSLNVSLGEDHYEPALSTHVGSSVSDELACRETRAGLLRAVGRLNGPARAAVRLHLMDGLTLSETSLLLGRSVSAVKTSVQRGRIALRAMLAPNAARRDPEADHLRVSLLGGHVARIGHRTLLPATRTPLVPRLGAPALDARDLADTTEARA